jgi:hypothetical protein
MTIRKIVISLLSILGGVAGCVVLCIGVFALYVYSLGSYEGCRDRMIADIPIYPESVKVSDEGELTDTITGSNLWVYQTQDPVEQVASFYDENSRQCQLVADVLGEKTYTCDGSVGASFVELTYSIYIYPERDLTKYEIDFWWNCGQD